jgi:hypothetical protein
LKAADRDALARAYQRTFCGAEGTPHADAALIIADLRRFCRTRKGGLEITRAGAVDPYATMYANGLRDAFARILGFIQYEREEVTNDVQADADDSTS